MTKFKYLNPHDAGNMGACVRKVGSNTWGIRIRIGADLTQAYIIWDDNDVFLQVIEDEHMDSENPTEFRAIEVELCELES